MTLLVKDNIPGQITLAIGDGANDVSMIQVPCGRRGRIDERMICEEVVDNLDFGAFLVHHAMIAHTL